MTYREKMAFEHPEEVSEEFCGGVCGCPPCFCQALDEDTIPDEDVCRRCWDREVEDE